MFFPFLILDRGYFIYYGDFNVQQIPFYQMAHDAVRSGNIFWSWTTDLGSNFIGSYSFYLLGSPFFWLTLVFPSFIVPYLMAPLLILKLSISAVAAYWFLRRFLKPDYALIGGLLYAFSGFSIYNIFFNHFHEAIIYFPLMLLSMELYMKEGKRGFLAATVFLSALSNYYFFIGQAVFLILYWIIRAMTGDWEKLGARFFGLLFEAVVGTAMAAVLLLPAYHAVSQNPRTENILAGWDLLIYTKSQRILDIIHSFFFPQDIPARASFFPDSDNKWSSMSAWIPVFGCTGVIAYVQSRRHSDWVRRLLVVLIIMALIPGLNSMFQLFNSMYYARWFYMLDIVMILATMRAIQDEDAILVNWTRAFGWAFGITFAFALFVGIAPKSWEPDSKTGKIVFGLFNRDCPEFYLVAVAVAALTLVLAALLIALHRREREIFLKWSVGVMVSVVLIFGWYSIGSGKVQGRFDSSYVIDRAIGGAAKIKLPDSAFSRVDFHNDMDNLGMFWGTPTIQAFHSIVPGSVMEFYPTVGVERNVGSRPDSTHYALRGLLSVQWLFDYANDDNTQIKNESSYFAQKDINGVSTFKMPGWSYYGEQNGYMIYKNDEYIPFGFTYDSYFSRTKYDICDESTRELSLLKTIVLEEEDIKKYGKYLTSFEESRFYNTEYSQDEYIIDCQNRRASAASSFTQDNKGFSAKITLEKDNLVFFSVPYEDGWTATVNGKNTEIVKANIGFMAVFCPAGKDISIRFHYQTPGLNAGVLTSVISLSVFALYLTLFYFLSKRKKESNQLKPVIPAIVPEERQITDNQKDDFDLYHLYPGSQIDDAEFEEPNGDNSTH